jgi:hypothetical protein
LIDVFGQFDGFVSLKPFREWTGSALVEFLSAEDACCPSRCCRGLNPGILQLGS